MRPEEAKQLTEVLKQVDFLTYLSFSDMESIADSVYHVKYRKGQTIIRQDDEGDTFFLIVKGKVSVVLEEGFSNKKLLKHLGPGEYFGEMSLLTGAPRTATIVADEDSEFFVLHKLDFKRTLQKNPAIADLIGRTFSHRKLQLTLKGSSEVTPEGMSDKIKKFFGI
ncbi:MAG: cyclic nucleotide-binding domain-containing protein [Elusimicrobiota bacterium]